MSSSTLVAMKTAWTQSRLGEYLAQHGLGNAYPRLEAVSMTLPPPAARVRTTSVSAVWVSGMSVAPLLGGAKPDHRQGLPAARDRAGHDRGGISGLRRQARVGESGAMPNPPASTNARRRVILRVCRDKCILASSSDRGLA